MQKVYPTQSLRMYYSAPHLSLSAPFTFHHPLMALANEFITGINPQAGHIWREEEKRNGQANQRSALKDAHIITVVILS